MPSVTVHLWPGRTAEFKRNIIQGITKVFEDNGIPAQAVEVILVEVPKENWGMGGVPASEKFPGK
jgi:4-oxalocrotonate tautomerase